MHCGHIVGERQCIIQRFECALMECRYRQNHPMASRGRGLTIAIQRKVLSQIHVMAMDGKETNHYGWQKHYNDPCSIDKLGDGEYQGNDSSDNCTQTVNCQFPSPAPVGVRQQLSGCYLPRCASNVPPVTCHPCL